MDPIQKVEAAKDLGVMIDHNMDFRTHRNKVIIKTKNKCNWVLRTFKSRCLKLLISVWKSCQPHQDYCGPLWSPVGTLYEMRTMEKIIKELEDKFVLE